jgi:hypothetical protein
MSVNITPEKLTYCLRKLEDGAVTVDTVVRRDRVGFRVGGPSDAELAQVYSALAHRGLATRQDHEWGVYGYQITDLGKQVLAGEVSLPEPAGAIQAGEGYAVGLKAWEMEQRKLGAVERVG